MYDDDAPAARCVICPRQLLDHETGRFICLPCEHRIDADLRQLAGPAGLYARLCLRVQPERSAANHGAVSGTPGRGVPPNLEVLSLTSNGGIVSTLETWVEDWSTYGLAIQGAGGRLQHRVDTAVSTLRRNLARAASRHPALDEFGKEIYKIRSQAEAIITGEKKPIPIPVVCPCGTITSITLNTDGFECRTCGMEYGHRAAMHLPMAERRAA
ncbi:hypothetical protein QA811_02095 [Streptomyces sp. B21-102]|uniref:hypothetical protein n=1 Tax=Streptomyces sp. B21-102 TaxID=3039416 RepID=UPI002FF26C5A